MAELSKAELLGMLAQTMVGLRWRTSSAEQWQRRWLCVLSASDARESERATESEREADGRGLFAVDHGQRCQAGHGAWRPRGGSGLWPVGHCADSEFSIQRSQPSLTAHFHSVETTKPLIISENILNENCGPSYSLQFLLKDQDLILKGS